MKLSCQFLNKVSKNKDPEPFWFHLLKSPVSSPSCNMHPRYNASRNKQIIPTQASAHDIPSCSFQIHHIICPSFPTSPTRFPAFNSTTKTVYVFLPPSPESCLTLHIFWCQFHRCSSCDSVLLCQTCWEVHKKMQVTVLGVAREYKSSMG